MGGDLRSLDWIIHQAEEGIVDQSTSTPGKGLKSWMARHYIASTVIAALIAFGLGTGSSQAGTDEISRLRSDLTAAERALQDTEARSSEELDSLQSELESLKAEKTELSEGNDALSQEVMMLNARRPLPSVVGQMSASAERLAAKYGWDIKVKRRYSTTREGKILAQSPAPGTRMRYEAPFTVVLAKPLPQLPRVVGMKKARALSELKMFNWQVTVVDQISGRRPGTVLAISPSAGSGVLPGSAITLTVAKKAPTTPAPTVSEGGGAGCTPGYSPCLPPASDYDCAGGTGDGPKYTGYVTVTGSDPYGLDSDSDGAGCES
jgi:cell division protein FtsB